MADRNLFSKEQLDKYRCFSISKTW